MEEISLHSKEINSQFRFYTVLGHEFTKQNCTLIIALFLSLLPSPLVAKSEVREPDDPRIVPATVYYCHDGDTCRILVADGLWINVRLAGIDAPEVGSKHRKGKSGQPMGNEARDFLNEKLKGKQVTVRQTDLDPYNRPVVEILLGETNINLEVIRAGFAEAYRGKTKRITTATYLAAEEQAKTEKKGVWSMKSYQSPKAFRADR
jgi:micrococcal nuclease